MVDFKKVDEYIEHIEQGTVPEGVTFNEFAMDFYHASKVIPMSKYLRNTGHTSKMPKIMNTKKVGEVLTDTEKAGDVVKTFLKRKGFDHIPELNYTVVMLVRKVELLENWKKITAYLSRQQGAHPGSPSNNVVFSLLWARAVSGSPHTQGAELPRVGDRKPGSVSVSPARTPPVPVTYVHCRPGFSERPHLTHGPWHSAPHSLSFLLS